MFYESFSADETEKIAKKISGCARSGDIFCLSGDLGAGKTVFAKGFAAGLGIEAEITSPTFTLINEYRQSRLPLFHFDVYRISSPYEMEDTGYEDYFYGDGVCLVEWAELIKDLIPHGAYKILIEKNYSMGDNYRSITLRRV